MLSPPKPVNFIFEFRIFATTLSKRPPLAQKKQLIFHPKAQEQHPYDVLLGELATDDMYSAMVITV